MPTRWIGIDEAGYGPNLGPLVMTAVVAESDDDRPPDVWGDLAATVSRAGGPDDRLWVDDSKALYSPNRGRDRLDATCLALAAAVEAEGTVPATYGQLLARFAAGDLADVELAPWLDGGDPPLPGLDSPSTRSFEGAPWRVVAVRSSVVGPARFNAGLDARGSKASVHFDVFAGLLRAAWDDGPGVVETHARGDKHGGRHFYYGPLADAFPDAWIDRGPEGPNLSRYTVREGGRRLDVRLEPRADAGDGLVALASVVSKSLREHWMDAFNAWWAARVPGLKPTAGYPVDAARFRAEIQSEADRLGLDPARWWRAR